MRIFFSTWANNQCDFSQIMCSFCFCKQILGFSKCDIPLNLKKEKEQAWIAQGCNPRSAWKSIFKFVAQKRPHKQNVERDAFLQK